MVHADIRPSLIGVPIARTDNFRLLDRLNSNMSPIEVQNDNIKRNKPLYISPILFKKLMDGKKKIKHNPFKSDVFSLGMIILEAGLFESVQGVYDREAGEIDKDELIALVEKFIEKYPDDFILQELLMIMLEFSPKLRQEPAALLKTIRKMQQIANERGEAMVSQINYHQDALANQLIFTDSGYHLKDMNQVQYSNFIKYDGGTTSTVINGEDVEEELKNSLMTRIKDRQSQIVKKSDLEKLHGEIQEDLEGEDSKYNTQKKIKTNFGSNNISQKQITKVELSDPKTDDSNVEDPALSGNLDEVFYELTFICNFLDNKSKRGRIQSHENYIHSRYR